MLGQVRAAGVSELMEFWASHVLLEYIVASIILQKAYGLIGMSK